MYSLSVNFIKKENQASRILDLLRFLSALTVFLFHFYIPLPGYQAVMIFFVLSGYFISSTVYKSLCYNYWSWGDYLIRRVVRLWIVLIPALILTLLWARLQFNIFGYTKAYGYLDWKTFMGNLFFLQGIVVKEYGLNGPLWSLSYEFWYYILFPCLVLMIVSHKKVIKVLYALIVLVIIRFVGLKIAEYFLVWLLGAIIPLIKPLKVKSMLVANLMIFFSTALFLASMKSYILLNNLPNLQILSDLCIGVTFSILIYVIISLFNNTQSKLRINVPGALAGFSYTLYLTHYPLANFILTWRASDYWTFTGIQLIFAKIGIAFGILFYAWVIASLTEKHTDKIRRSIYCFIFESNKSFSNKYSQEI